MFMGNSSGTTTAAQHKLFKSKPIHDRSSTFIGLFSPMASAKELQATVDFRDAAHRIAAWRKPSNSQRSVVPGQGGIIQSGYDDDGESRAGRVLEKVLNDSGTQGSLVVARWWGGVLLGPVRFKHIEDVAKEAVDMWRSEIEQEQDEVEAKKRKLEEEKNEREQKPKLVRVLKERDSSIDVLRQLLKEKMAQATDKQNEDSDNISRKVDGGSVATSSPSTNLPASPSKAPLDYNSMPLARLKMLERARDATIAAILKKLDDADQKQSSPPPQPDAT